MVINRQGADTVEEGISLKKAEEVIGKPIFWQIPNDPKAVIGGAGRRRTRWSSTPRRAACSRASPGWPRRSTASRSPRATTAGSKGGWGDSSASVSTRTALRDGLRHRANRHATETNTTERTDEQASTRDLEAQQSEQPRRQQHLAAVQPQHGRQHGSGGKSFDELKRHIHAKLVEKLDFSRVSDLAGDALRREIRRVVERLCDTENPLLNRMERERLIDEVLDETLGFGPLEVLLKDPTISDILVNGPHKIYVERRGKLEKTDVKFRDNDHLLQIIDRIVSKVGRRVDETSPMVDARLPDGSRVNAIIPPLALDGAELSHSPLRRQPAEARRPAQLQGVHARDGDAHGGVHQGPAQHPHQRRYRLR